MHTLLLVLALLYQSIDGWWLTSSGAAHCVMTGNHMMCERFDQYGNSNGHVVNNWYPWFCRVWAIEGGGGGTPLRIYLAPPNGYGVSCYGGANYSPYYGWHTNTGHYEGQQVTASPAWTELWFVPGRDPASPSA